MERRIGERAPRRVVGSYGSYAEAQRAVDYLSDEGFAVERVSIVAEGLRFVEQVTGRVGYGRAALQGASSGAVIGAFFGFFLGLFSLVDPLVSALVLVLYGLVFGAIIGAIIGLISHAASGGRRDFSSVGGMEADHYNVMADEEVAEEAQRLLSGLR
ncbi:MAG: glycine zipper family protein [Actinomycetota bacterium]|nr:glycine zipper family protein [Actinomycetota bacterium]